MVAHAAWDGLCREVSRRRSELVLLPEFAGVDAVWQAERFDERRWAEAMAQADALVERLPGLGAATCWRGPTRAIRG